MWSGWRYGAIDMQHDFSRSSHNLDLSLIFKITSTGQIIINKTRLLNASRQEKHDAGKINVVAFLSQKLLSKNRLFW